MIRSYSLIAGLWVAWIVIWMIAAVRTKRVARRQSGASWLIQRVLVIAGAILLIFRSFGSGWLHIRLWPDSAALAYAAVGLTFAGLAFSVWARFALGKNWSAEVTIKQNHELIRNGPYALVRHPIYSGVLLAILGTALVIAEVRGLLAIVLVTTGFWLKLQTEEAFMLVQFGDQYRRYQHQVKALIPFIL